jgi:hypothetical protein
VDWQSAEALSALDEEAGVLYALLYHRPGPYLIGLDLASGVVVANVSLVAEFVTQQFVGVGQFVAAMGGGRLVVGGDTADGSHLIGVLDVASGTFNRSALLPRSAQDTSSSSAAYIPDDNSVVIQRAAAGPPLVIEVFVVSLDTGGYRKSDDNYDTDHNLWTFSWDASLRRVVGLGLEPNITRSIVALDPASLAMQAVCSEPTWLMEAGDMAALDVRGRTIYWLSQPAGTPITDDDEPWFLVGMDVDTCSIRSSAWLGNGTQSLPCEIAVRHTRAHTPMRNGWLTFLSLPLPPLHVSGAIGFYGGSGGATAVRRQ